MEDLYPWSDCTAIPFKRQDQSGREKYVFSRMEHPTLHILVKKCNIFDLKTKNLETCIYAYILLKNVVL